MLYFFGLLIVLSISVGATIPNHPSNNEHLNLHKRETESPEYIIKIDSDNGEDNATCLPTPTNKQRIVPCRSLNYSFQYVYSGIDGSVIFSLVSPKYDLSSNETFQNLKHPISIIGNSSTINQPVIVQCTAPKSSGLTFLHSSNITIKYVRFVGCGAVHSSTSRDYTQPKMQMLLINVTLYFYNCSDVDMYRVEVVNSSQATGVVMYDTNGQIQVTECIFYNNSANDSIPGGGGFAVEFTYCSPGDTGCHNNYKFYNSGYRSINVAAEYTFTDCHFEKNVARGQSYTSSAGNLIFASLANHTAVGRGGGLSVYFKGVARNKLVSINNCDFIRNSAVWGGGLLIEMDDNTISNSIQISHCNFTGNHAFFNEDFGTGGGGLRIATTLYFWDCTYLMKNYSRNEILVEYSDFIGNKAIQGGAISFSVARQRWSYLSQVTYLLVLGCTFDSNRAQIGSAVSGTLYPVFSEGFIAPVTFCDCSFLSNRIRILYDRNLTNTLKSHPAGMGAVYMSEVAAIFSNHVTFMDNHGTALVAIGAQVNFDGTCAHFSNNSGSTGGALALLGASSILTGPKTSMEFTDNYASIYGGAIYNQYISKEDLKSSVDCFFRYSDPFVGPFNWSAHFRFSRNSAKKLGNSIYSTAALPCLWAKPSTNGNYQSEYIFCNQQQWTFTDSYCKKQVYTEAHNVSLWANKTLPIKVYPGRGIFLPLDAFDDFNHTVTDDTVYAADIQSEYAKVEPSFTYVAHNYIIITGVPGKNVNMSMYTAGSRTTYIKLSLQIELCPPGFEYESENDSDMEIYLINNNKPDKYSSCKCPAKTVFNGNLRCLEHEFHSQIRNGYWIGVLESDGKNDTQDFQPELLMGLIPQYYVTKGPYGNEYINISMDYNFTKFNEKICGGVNRNGTLCGTCYDGYAVAINSRTYECVLCNNTIAQKVGYAAAYIALTYLPILGMFFAIIIFNFKLTSSAALSFVLFAQMIGSGVFNLTADEAFYLNNTNVDRMEKAYTVVYGFFNLNSLAFLMKPICISERLTTLDVLALEYVVAAFPIAMIIMIYLVHRCKALKCSCYERRRRNRQLRGAGISSTTTVQSTDTMQKSAGIRGPKSTLIHTFIAFLFLSYTKFSLASMFTISITRLFDKDGYSRGSDYLHVYYAGHLRFSDHKYLFPYGILAILILIFIVILPPLLLLGPIQVIDWLIDKRGFRWLQRLWPSITIHTFLDTFQGFYKPNRRFFSGIYFLFRLAIFLNFSFSQTVIERYIFQQIAVMILVVLVALFRPYIRDFYNYLDVLVLSNLGILNVLAIFIHNKRFSSFPYKVYVVECILVWLPLVYMLCYAVWNRVHKRKQYTVVKDKFIRLINPTKFSREEGTSEEREQFLGNNPDIFTDKSLDESLQINTNEDPDERLFRRATKRNRYRSTNQNQPHADTRAGRSVSTTVVSMLEGSEKDLVKRDSGTSTGGSSRSGFDSNDS